MEITPGSAVYVDFLREVKNHVLQSRHTAARSVNRALIGLYWSIGRLIVERQDALGWGNAVVERLSADLRSEFPDMTGFSPRNLWDFKRFYETYAAAPEKLRQAVAEIPWGHNILIMQRIKEEPARLYLFYHRFLKCLVAVELKTGRFRPEYAGKMDFYLEVFNDKE